MQFHYSICRDCHVIQRTFVFRSLKITAVNELFPLSGFRPVMANNSHLRILFLSKWKKNRETDNVNEIALVLRGLRPSVCYGGTT
jgi:hypothetical protein